MTTRPEMPTIWYAAWGLMLGDARRLDPKYSAAGSVEDPPNEARGTRDFPAAGNHVKRAVKLGRDETCNRRASEGTSGESRQPGISCQPQ